MLFAPTSKKTSLKILKFKKSEEADKKTGLFNWKLDENANSNIQVIEGNQIEVGELFRNAYWNNNDKIYFFTDKRFIVLEKEKLDIIS